MGETTRGEEWSKRETDGVCAGGRDQRSCETYVPRFPRAFLFNHFLPTPESGPPVPKAWTLGVRRARGVGR